MSYLSLTQIKSKVSKLCPFLHQSHPVYLTHEFNELLVRATMNRRNFCELCCLFCCPPCPGKITSKLAFLPPEPSYAATRIAHSDRYRLSFYESAEWHNPDIDKSKIQLYFTKTDRGNTIACIYITCCSCASYVLLFSHGNAVDVGHMCGFYLELGKKLNCNVMSYDYSGYGLSNGKPSEKNLYSDIEAAWSSLLSKFNVNPSSVILYGQSIGTVPTIDLACKYEAKAVILHSPLMSGMRVVFPGMKKSCFLDVLPSIDKIEHIKSPTLVIHGTEDEVIDFSHGLTLYENCPKAVEPLWVLGAGHNDVEHFDAYMDRLVKFVRIELSGSN